MFNDRLLVVSLARTLHQPVSKIVAFLRGKGTALKLNRALDTTIRGMGNRANRRRGIEPDTSCDCVVCTVYGGDCAAVMYREGRLENHRARRRVRTRRKGA